MTRAISCSDHDSLTGPKWSGNCTRLHWTI